MHSLWLAFFCTFLLCSCFFAVVFSCDFAPWLCLHLVLCSFNPLDKEACFAEIAPSALSKNKRSKLSAAGEVKKHSMSLVPVSCSPQCHESESFFDKSAMCFRRALPTDYFVCFLLPSFFRCIEQNANIGLVFSARAAGLQAVSFRGIQKVFSTEQNSAKLRIQ